MSLSAAMNDVDLLKGQRYVKEDAEDILSVIDSVLREFLKVDERGIWISHDYPIGLSWVPLLDVDYPGSPNPRTHPALPFPFSAQQLTAFMLDGIGSVIREQFGAWRDGPDESTLSRLPDQATKATEVLRLAFRAYQAAVAVVGDAAHLGDEASETAHTQWRKQMVVALIDTAGSADAAAETPEQRQARRYSMCVNAGLTLPNNDYANLPRGIGALAKQEGVSRQAFSADVKKHINRLGR